jgi:hypothetical protein
VAVGLGAVGVATSAPVPVDAGRPGRAARLATVYGSGRVSRASRMPFSEVSAHQPLYSSSLTVNGRANGVSVGPVSLDKTNFPSWASPPSHGKIIVKLQAVVPLDTARNRC